MATETTTTDFIFEKLPEMELFLKSPPASVKEILKIDWNRLQIVLRFNEKEMRQENMEICPDCHQKTVEEAWDNNMMGEFHYKHCTRDDCHYMLILDVDKPSWLRVEERESRPHRVLPSGDVEYADEYGGY